MLRPSDHGKHDGQRVGRQRADHLIAEWLALRYVDLQGKRMSCGWRRRAQAGILCAIYASTLGLIASLVGCAPPRGSRVTIGAKNFTEQVVLGELLAQEIEASTGQRVDRRVTEWTD